MEDDLHKAKREVVEVFQNVMTLSDNDFVSFMTELNRDGHPLHALLERIEERGERLGVK